MRDAYSLARLSENVRLTCVLVIRKTCMLLEYALYISCIYFTSILAYGARGMGFDSRSCRYDFSDW